MKEDHSFEWTGGIEPVIAATVSGGQMYTYSVQLTIELERLESIMEEWQNETYNVIVAAYQVKQAEYESALADREFQQQEETERREAPSSANRTIEQRELKRLCIDMLIRPFASVNGITMGERHYEVESDCETQFHQTHLSPQLERYASHVKFFEQAFEWELIAYLFYPYYWANKCDWLELLRLPHGIDEVFHAFLQSGMARVMVPVRLGFQDAVIFYMETGQIWNGGDLVFDHTNDLYLSIAEELQEIEGMVEDTWQTRIPSDLTIIQKDSASLIEGGLPCCEDVTNSGSGTNIESTTNKLAILRPTTDGGTT